MPELERRTGDERWRPAGLLSRLADQGASFLPR
jgi:hypothetical protein